MRKVEAFVRHDKFEEVETSLRQIGIGGLTYYPVKGFGTQRTPGRPEDAEHMKLEIFVDEFQLDKLVELIMRIAPTGKPSDGKIVVSSIDNVYRIRTKEEGPKAI